MKDSSPNCLTTHYECNLLAQLNLTKSNSIPACLVCIAPKDKQIRLNEERGEWILQFWKKVIENDLKMEGHRIDWSNIIIFNQSMNYQDFHELILNLLTSSTSTNLKSLAIFSKLKGNTEQKIKEIDLMGLQLIKIGYWHENIYPKYYEDGIEIKLKNI